ncbi:alpha/beta fold hydrolase [[Clostridium] polysaccharolyticum]|uniref:Pimeloyl-ACP methyl ester carboxylesterase n=1 Tax=[Clostridium] polysaccharolyticum TaxID=29364 RepID=A0A1I0F2E1_9FIRM|nr:alpha/beta fold hydrolase [[Clostridium] polysaccharolyticum]SET52165.1 Pimeloyl-ACP methyl ester carboxylesterase [[Clostridium] polysaccharolyticum]
MNSKKTLSTILKTVIITTSGLYLINKFLQVKATSKERLYSSNSNYYNWKFGNIYYTVHGSGSPILLIHDLTCESSSYEWKRVVNKLAKEHTVYTIDLIGCGHSDKPKITYTNYLYVQLITDFIKNVIKRSTHVIATGLSCSATVMACYIEPQQIQKLTLVNPCSLQELSKYPGKWNKLIKKLIEIPVIGSALYNMKHSFLGTKQRFADLYYCDTRYIAKHDIEAYMEASHLNGYSAKFLMSSITSKFVNINISRALKQLNHDIHIILGDALPNCESIKNCYYELNNSIEINTISNTKHLPQLENPEAFIDSIYF